MSLPIDPIGQDERERLHKMILDQQANQDQIRMVFNYGRRAPPYFVEQCLNNEYSEKRKMWYRLVPVDPPEGPPWN